MSPTSAPSPLGTVVLDNALACEAVGPVAAVHVSPVGNGTNSSVSSNGTDTCLFVTLMDNYGDGWANSTRFYYWVQIRDDDSNVVSMSLDCGCGQMSGCVHPTDLNIDQLFHLTLLATDAEGDVFVPEYAWEMHWTVQVVERGVWMEKYYGGYNTSMVF